MPRASSASTPWLPDQGQALVRAMPSAATAARIWNTLDDGERHLWFTAATGWWHGGGSAGAFGRMHPWGTHLFGADGERLLSYGGLIGGRLLPHRWSGGPQPEPSPPTAGTIAAIPAPIRRWMAGFIAADAAGHLAGDRNTWMFDPATTIASIRRLAGGRAAADAAIAPIIAAASEATDGLRWFAAIGSRA